MKNRRTAFILGFLLLTQGVISAETTKKITNVDWLLMSQKDKESYITSKIQDLRSQGVAMNKTPQQYIALIDEVTESPTLKPTTVDNILTVSILVNEPGARRSNTSEPEIKKIAMH